MSSVQRLETMLQASSNVECGLNPSRGRGFQTVALSPGLAGTADLRLLEDLAAYYEVSAGRRAMGDLPVKSTFFYLPSGSCAVGRTVDWGAGPGGRPGNYLARHLIAPAHSLEAIGGPFALTETAWEGSAAVNPDEPREVPAFTVEIAPISVSAPTLRTLSSPFLLALATHAADPGSNTALLVGEEERTLRILRELHSVLPSRERMQLTLSTHFYRACDALRPHFRVVTVSSWSEAPAQRQAYRVFDLDRGEHPALAPGGYAKWLAPTIQASRESEIAIVTRAADRLRRGEAPDSGDLPTHPASFAALWALVGPVAAAVAPRRAEAVTELLRLVAEPRVFADALLAQVTPRELCGGETAPDSVKACLTALRGAASSTVWKKWLEKWHGEPLLASFRAPGWAFWKR